jgi:hypothetical protein
VELLGEFAGGAQFPSAAMKFPVEPLSDLFHHTVHIDHRMPLEHPGKTVGEVAGQAFSRALAQLEFQVKGVLMKGFVREPDIESPFIGIPEKGFKKHIVPTLRKKALKVFPSKKIFQFFIFSHERPPKTRETSKWDVIYHRKALMKRKTGPLCGAFTRFSNWKIL